MDGVPVIFTSFLHSLTLGQVSKKDLYITFTVFKALTDFR